MRISYSALTSFNQCPLKYKWQYVERIKVPPMPDLFFGSLVHQILEIALKNDPVIPPLEKLLEIYKNQWKSEVFITSHPELAKDLDSSAKSPQNDNLSKEKEYFDLGIKMITDFYHDYKPGLVTILETEKFFEIFWQDHKIVGKIDRIDRLPTGEIEIVDYKTNKNLPSDYDIANDFQLPLYRWAGQTIFSENQPIKLMWYFLRYNKKIINDNINNLTKLQKYILDTIAKIETSDFSANPTKLCSWCEYLHVCEKGQKFISNQVTSNKTINKNQNENTTKNFTNYSIPKSYKLKAKSSKIISPDQQSLF